MFICIAIVVSGDRLYLRLHPPDMAFCSSILTVDYSELIIDTFAIPIDYNFAIDNRLFAVGNLSFCHFWHSIVVSLMCLSSNLAKSAPDLLDADSSCFSVSILPICWIESCLICDLYLSSHTKDLHIQISNRRSVT